MPHIPSAPKRRGRPPGSKNKPKESQVVAAQPQVEVKPAVTVADMLGIISDRLAALVAAVERLSERPDPPKPAAPAVALVPPASKLPEVRPEALKKVETPKPEKSEPALVNPTQEALRALALAGVAVVGVATVQAALNKACGVKRVSDLKVEQYIEAKAALAALVPEGG